MYIYIYIFLYLSIYLCLYLWVNRTLPKEAPEFDAPRRVAGALGGREEGSEHISAGLLRVPLRVLGF